MGFMGLLRHLWPGRDSSAVTLEQQLFSPTLAVGEQPQLVQAMSNATNALVNLQQEVSTLLRTQRSCSTSSNGSIQDTANRADQNFYGYGNTEAAVPQENSSKTAEQRRTQSSLVRLDVGGRHFTTSRQTLEMYSESKLAAMVSGRFGAPTTSDDGRLFVDRDGNLFPYVLEFLRNGPNWQPPKDPSLRELLLDEFDYYNLPWVDALEQWGADDGSSLQHLYALGGWGMNSMERYSFARGRWDLCGNLPQTGYENVAACVLGGKFLIAGGGLEDTGAASSLVDPLTSKCTAIKPLSCGRSMHAVVTCRDKAYVLGGSTPDMLHMPGELYVPEKDTWVQFKGPEASLRRCSAAELDGVIYAAAGCLQQRDGEAYCGKVVQMYDPRIGTWQTRGSLRFARERHAVVAVGDRLWCIGGLPPRGEDTYRASVECYEPRTCTSLVVPDMSVARAGCSAVVAGPYIYVLGGYGRDRLDSPSLSLVERLDWARCQWTVAKPMMVGRTKHTVLAI